jgi:hypothetical protein
LVLALDRVQNLQVGDLYEGVLETEVEGLDLKFELVLGLGRGGMSRWGPWYSG